jgi:hypothetical protein
MANVINLIGEKQKRAWGQLKKTLAQIKRARAARTAEVLTSRLQRAQRKLERETREAGEAAPHSPRLTVVPPDDPRD